MSQMGKNVIKLVALVFAAAVMVGITEVAVEADPGDVLKTVNIPAAAQCSGGSGNALTVVSGGKAGFPKIPVLLVTSCVSGGQIKLFLLDPSAANAGNGNTAALIKSFSTIFPATPPTLNAGWEALALRADKGDIIACGTTSAGTVLWSIDFNPSNNTNPPSNPPVPDGTATFVVNGPTGSSCDAIAWDATNKTIFQTPLTGDANVFHFSETGASLSPIPSGCTTPISGLGVAGTSLFVGCDAPDSEFPSKVRQVYKGDDTFMGGGTLRREFDGPSDFPAGLPDDPTTLASHYKELLWTLDASSAQFLAVEIPGGTIGQLTGEPVLFPGVGSGANACPTDPLDPLGGPLDTDQDGLPDCWEDGDLWDDGKPGISYNGIYYLHQASANRDVTLCVTNPPVPTIVPPECANKDNKDIFVEIDYMKDIPTNTKNHSPNLSALGQVMDVFRLAPTPPGPVRLHVQVDEAIPHNDTTALVPCTVKAVGSEADFDSIKFPPSPTTSVGGFGTSNERISLPTKSNVLNAKALAFRYGLFVHNLSPTAPLNTSTGCAEIGGNDLVVSLGSWGAVLQPDGSYHKVGTTDEQAGTLLHELGHTLGLRHGGGDNVNCKPNYISVMNYTRQLSSPSTRPLDYSRMAHGVCLPSRVTPTGEVCPPGEVIGLNKSNLSEGFGIGGTPEYPRPGSPADPSIVKVVYGPPLLGKVAVASASAIAGISWNRDTDTTDPLPGTILSLDINQMTGCPANQGTDLTGTLTGTNLLGFNDWPNIQFNFRGSLDFSGGAREGVEPSTVEIDVDTALGLSRDVIDIKPNDKKNTIDRSVQQTVGVAIFSRYDDSVPAQLELDAPDIDPATLILRGAGEATWALSVKQNANGKFQCNTKDVNKDSLDDLVCHFTIPPNTIGLGETQAVLQGKTFDTFGGQSVLSSDFIRVLP